MPVDKTPGNLLTNSSQTADIAAFYISVMAMREMSFADARPQLRPSGILMDSGTSEQDYALPVPALALGKTVRFKDGDRPGARKSQGYILKGKVIKRAVEPVRFSEADRLATRVNWVASTIKAHGRAEALLEDREGTSAIEDGTSATNQPSFDGKAYFATDHFQNPQAGTGSQSNLIDLALTPDGVFAAKQQVYTWKAENGDPIYAGMEPNFLLMVPPALEQAALKAIKRSHVAEGNAAVENISEGIAGIFVNKFLTNDRNWYLWVMGVGVAPLMRVVFRERKRRDKGPDSELFRDTEEIEILSDEWTDYRLTDWRVGIKSVPK